MTRGRALLAAAVVAVVVAGAIALGVWLGRVTDPGPAIVVSGGPVVEASPDVSSLPLAQLPQADPSASAAPPVVLVPGSGLSDTATTASAYRLTTAGLDPQKVAARLAGAFGVAGAPRSSTDQVVIGDLATVTVHRDARMSWEFQDPQAAASAPVGTLPTRAQALDLAQALLGGIGVDSVAVDWQVERVADGVRVTGWQLVAGARTSLAWTVTLGRSGAVLGATGFSAGLQELPGYPVVGARFAVARGGVTPWTALPPLPVAPAAAPAAAAAAPAAAAPGPSASGATASGATATAPTAASTASPVPPGPPGPVLQVPVQQVTVTDATLGLAQYPQADGSLLILPAWLVTGTDGSQWSVIAVAGDAVSFGTPASPSAS